MNGPKLNLGQIILHSAQFSHREDFLSLPPTTIVEKLGVELSVQAQVENDGTGAVVRLRVVTPQNSGDAPLYTFDVSVLALFRISEGPLPDEHQVAMTGASVLLPFLREAVANLTARGRFGPVWLQVMNVREAFKGAAEISNAMPPAKPAVKPVRRNAPRRKPGSAA